MPWLIVGCACTACLLAIAVTAVRRQRELVFSLRLDEIVARAANVVLLDVRTAKEHSSDHVPNALLLPQTDTASSIDRAPRAKGQLTVVYCERGVRARIAQKALIDAGFDNVFHLKGDMSAWRRDGRRVE